MPFEIPFLLPILIVILLLVFFSLVPVGLWVTAQFSGVHVKISQLIGMRLRRVIPKNIINPLIKATKAGLNLTTNQLEAHYLAGGNVNTLVNALIAAQRADIELEFERAAAIDLAGRNVLEAVQVSVNPKVIETPNIAAVAMNGIEVIVKAKVTVRANIERLIGGAGEETIIARVGEVERSAVISREVRGSRTLCEPMADRFLVLPFIGRSRIVDLDFKKGDEEGKGELSRGSGRSFPARPIGSADPFADRFPRSWR